MGRDSLKKDYVGGKALEDGRAMTEERREKDRGAKLSPRIEAHFNASRKKNAKALEELRKH
jgi:hypothetical protein